MSARARLSTRNGVEDFRFVAPRRMPRIIVLCLAAAALSAGDARAGGLYVNEFSTTSQGNAGVGRGAWAPDASATLHNPAAMTALDDHGLAGGMSALFGRVRFDPSPTSPNGTGRGGNQTDPALLPSINYVHKVADRVRFGFSFFALAGAALDPSNGWAGRFEVTDLALTAFAISPTLAVRVTDWLSVGGGPIAGYAQLDWDLRVGSLPPGGPENQLRLKDLDDWEAAGRVGVFLEPTDALSLSVYYQSETDFKLRGKTRGPVGLFPSLSLGLPFPQAVEVSAHFQIDDRLALLGTFNWEDWSTADSLSVAIGGRSIPATTGFRDTYKVGIGANYQIAEDWVLQTGLMYDTSGLRNKTRTTALPIDEQIRFSLGFQHDLNDSLTLGASFTYAHLGDSEVRTPNVVGDYDENSLFILGATLAFKSLPWSGKLTF